MLTKDVQFCIYGHLTNAFDVILLVIFQDIKRVFVSCYHPVQLIIDPQHVLRHLVNLGADVDVVLAGYFFHSRLSRLFAQLVEDLLNLLVTSIEACAAFGGDLLLDSALLLYRKGAF